MEDGDSLAIASGTTTLELVKALENKKNLTIITNSIDAAVAAMDILNNMEVEAPFDSGRVVVENILDSGANVILAII